MLEEALWHGHVWVPLESLTGVRISTMNGEVYRAILSAHIQPDLTKLVGRSFVVQMDNDPRPAMSDSN